MDREEAIDIITEKRQEVKDEKKQRMKHEATLDSLKIILRAHEMSEKDKLTLIRRMVFSQIVKD
tara:strand:- start:348 stop:539 length:192 start_codon:yes stop_codon:yes gene_type:complete